MTISYVNEIEQIVQDVLTMTVDREVLPVEACRSHGHQTMISAIEITGGWNGVVVLDTSPGLARAAAQNMLRQPAEGISDQDLCEVTEETVNMVGGNLKSLLPGPSRLSLPKCLTEQEVADRTAGCELIDDALLGCDAGYVRIRLFASQG